MLFDVNGWELAIIIVLAIVLIGPDRLPEYAAKLARGVRQLRQLAEGAKVQLREQMGPEFDDIDWAVYDPRQYDPRRIVREALASDGTSDVAAQGDGSDVSDRAEAPDHGDGSGFGYTPATSTYDPSLPTPYDPDAT